MKAKSSKATLVKAEPINQAAPPPLHPLPWQSQDWQRLTTAAARHHAILLQGRAGIGVEQLAHALLAWKLCERRETGQANTSSQPNQASQPQAATLDVACGACPSCTWLAAHTHSDAVYLLTPQTLVERDWPMPPDWVRSGAKPSQDITVGQVRWLVEWFALTATRSQGKAALLYPAESMNRVSQNALLKLLEEPPPGALLILAAERGADLLPTIRSRCHAVVCTTPDAQATQDWLQQQADLSAPDAAALARWSHGQPLGALPARASLDWARLWLRSFSGNVATRGINDELIQATPAVALAALERLASDLMRLRWGSPAVFLAEAEARILGAIRFDERRLSEFQGDLPRRIRLSEHPVNAKLFTEALLLEFSQCLS